MFISLSVLLFQYQIKNLGKAIFFVSLLAVISCKPADNHVAHGGDIDMLSKQTTLLKLIGEWEFYWDTLLVPEDFADGRDTLLSPTKVRVPQPWHTYVLNDGTKIPRRGYATYRAKINIKNKEFTSLGLYIPLIWCASKIYVNGDESHISGKVSKTIDGYKNDMTFHLESINLKENSNVIEIIVQVSSFDFFTGGIIEPFIIGDNNDIVLFLEARDTLQVVILAVIFIIGFFNIILFYYNKTTIINLYFSFICFSMILKGITFGHHFVYEYLKDHNFLPYFIQNRLYYISTFSLVGLGLLYIRNLYPSESNKKIINWYNFISVLYFIFIAVAPSVISMLTITYFQIFIILGVLYLLIILIKAFLKKRAYAQWQAFGISIMVIAAINDVFNFINGFKYSSFEFLPLALTGMVIIQFIILGKIYSKTLVDLEYLNSHLEQEIDKKTEHIEKKNNELNKAYTRVRDSIRYAGRIQQAILNKEEEIKRNFRDYFILFLPKDIVSGDFYWFKRVKKENSNSYFKVLVVADCTGHGIPAALLTVMGNDILNEFILQNSCNESTPALLLKALDESVKDHLHHSLKETNESIQDGMDISVLLIDEKERIVYYAGAKRPLYYHDNKELKVLKGDGIGIGYFYKNKEIKFTNHTIHLDNTKEVIFYLFTDGITDQFDRANYNKFSSQRFRELIKRIHKFPMERQRQDIQQEFLSWKGSNKQIDDVLVLGVKI